MLRVCWDLTLKERTGWAGEESRTLEEGDGGARRQVSLIFLKLCWKAPEERGVERP